MENKRNALLVLGISLLFGDVIMAQEQAPSNMMKRAEREYRIFKEALACIKEGGFRRCSPAQKKRIVGAALALASIVVAIVYRLKTRRKVAFDSVTKEIGPPPQGYFEDLWGKQPESLRSAGSSHPRKLERRGVQDPKTLPRVNLSTRDNMIMVGWANNRLRLSDEVIEAYVEMMDIYRNNLYSHREAQRWRDGLEDVQNKILQSNPEEQILQTIREFVSSPHF